MPGFMSKKYDGKKDEAKAGGKGEGGGKPDFKGEHLKALAEKAGIKDVEAFKKLISACKE